jgi:ubiquinone/menaquinone biosynthesis C-methylase UbiE
VLEIGFGTGLNLPFYPPTLRRLTVVDPNPGMARRARPRVAASGVDVRSLVLDAGRRLPIDDGSFDAVVSTWTLCSIPDVAAALAEVHRVLKPGGRFVFVEHGLAPDPPVAAWQRRLDKLNQFIGDGCHLTRDIASILRRSPLSAETCDTFYLADTPRVGGFTYRGHATKQS